MSSNAVIFVLLIIASATPVGWLTAVTVQKIKDVKFEKATTQALNLANIK